MNNEPKENNIRSVLNLLTTGDKILIAMLLILGISSAFAINVKQLPGEMCSVEVSGKIVHQLKLSEEQNISVEGALGTTTIQIKNKKIRVTHSACPEKICVNTGWISKVGQIIVCVPNKVVLKINGENHDFFNVITQ